MLRVDMRVVFLALLLLAFGASAGAQEPRVFLTGSDDYAQAAYISLPSTGIFALDGTFDLEVGEPMPTCIGAKTPVRSYWFLVATAPGTLVIDTTFSGGTSFDPAIMVFKRTGETFAGLSPLPGGCNDDAGLGTIPGEQNDAKLSIAVPDGEYAVQITCVDGCAGTSLHLMASLIPPAGAIPSNDNFANAAALQLGKLVKVKNAAYATNEPNENIELGCNGFNTVWYSFTAPASGQYQIQVAGSVVYYGQQHSYGASIGVFTGSGSIADLAMEDCYPATPILSQSLVLDLPAEAEIYIRLGFPFDIAARTGSRYAIKIVPLSFMELNYNPQFLDTSPDGPVGWTVKTDDLDDIPQTIAGDNAMVFEAGGGAKSIKQTIGSTSWGGAKLKKGSLISAFGSYQTSTAGVIDATAELIVKYKDGTSSKHKRPLLVNTGLLGTLNWQPFDLTVELTSSSVSKITLQIKRKSGTGDLYVNLFAANYYSAALRSRGGVLPLPAPSDG